MASLPARELLYAARLLAPLDRARTARRTPVIRQQIRDKCPPTDLRRGSPQLVRSPHLPPGR
jgi:hypothetical protein